MSEEIASLADYRRQLRSLMLTTSRVWALACVGLILGGILLDASLYPQHLQQFLLLRLGAIALVLLVHFVLGTAFGAAHVRMFTLSWLLVPQAMICWMIYLTGGESSIYFAGLHLAFYGTGIVLPVILAESIAFGLTTLLLYVLACVAVPGGVADLAQFSGHLAFVGFSAVLASFCTYVNVQGRRKLLGLQQQIELKNQDLQATNEALVEVKGRLIHQEKMAAIGTLSAGLLHEVNNPVNYSLMALEAARQDVRELARPELTECFEDAMTGLRRVQSIVTDLKSFAYNTRGQQEVSGEFKLHEVVETARRMSAYEIRGIQVNCDWPEQTLVTGDGAAVAGVFINLFVNAGMAIKSARPALPAIHIRGWVERGRLFVSFKDNGCGIASEHLNRVFEPFFTTRTVGAGLGLGLSISYAIVQRHGGELKVASVPGEWTEFTLDLPLVGGQPQAVDLLAVNEREAENVA